MNEVESIANVINENKKFLITSHENPDCDAIGSTLSLGLALKSLEKEVVLYNKNEVPTHLKFLPNWDEVKNDVKNLGTNIDCFIILDCTDTIRPGFEFHNYIESVSEKPKIIIDHHKTNNKDIELCWVDSNAASTGILVYKLLKELRIDITKGIADCILATIIGDTGSFKYSNTNSEALLIASVLVDLGGDPEKISQSLYENESVSKIRLLSEALKTLEIDETNRIASVYVDSKMFSVTNTKREDTEGIVNIPRSIKGISVAMLIRQEKNDEQSHAWKVSLRSKEDVDVSEIASKFGGGGHHKAAGFSIRGQIEQVRAIVVKTVRKALK